MSRYHIKLVSIILPTYNESGNIVDLINEIEKVVKLKKEIILVDDNSPDGTAKKVTNYIKRYKKYNILVEMRTENRGLTNSIKHGIVEAKGDVIVWLDCDFSHPPIVINKLLEKIEEGYDIAVASRFIKNGGFIIPEGSSNDSWLVVLLSRWMNYLIQFFLDRRFKDYTSGFIAIKSEIFKKISLRGDYGEYFIDLIYKALSFKFKVVEIPYVQDVRREGESKTGQNLRQYLKRGSKYIILTFQLMIEKHLLHKFP